jgi:Fe2+ or Zn2+ uptake regulation protein
MNDEILKSAEEQLHKQLLRMGMKGTRQRNTVLRTLLRMEKPVSSSDLLFAVKREDITVSFGSVCRTLQVMVACGLASKFEPADGPATYIHHLAAPCAHQHHVCKECGADVNKTRTHASIKA